MNSTDATKPTDTGITTYQAALDCFNKYCGEKNLDPNVLPFKEPKDDEEENTNAYHMIKIIVKTENGGKRANALDSNQVKYFSWFEPNPSGSGLSLLVIGHWRRLAPVPARLCSVENDSAREIANKFMDIYNILQN